MKSGFNLSFITKISMKYYGTKPISVKKFHSENNFVYLLRFKDTKKVIKIDKDRGGWKINKELYLFKMLKDYGIPIPKVEHFDTSKKLIPYDWCIMEYLGEKNLNELFLDSGGKTKNLFFELGKIFARIHNIKFKEQGLLSANEIEKESFYGSHKKSFESGIKNLLSHKKITKEECIFVRKAFKEFKESNNTRLCHDDFGPWQAIVNKDRITGIIDWEWAKSSEPLYDLAKAELQMSLWSGNIDAFEKGYDRITPLPKDYEKTKKTYQIIEAINIMNYLLDNDKKFTKIRKIFLKLLDKS